MQVRVGEAVPLAVQIHDMNEGLKVRAIIFDPIGVILEMIDLPHVANGLYAFNMYLMPNVEYINVQYVPNNLTDYGVALDTFTAIPKESKKYIGEIVESIKLKRHSGILCDV